MKPPPYQPVPWAPLPKPAKLSTTEEKLAGVNGGFAVFLGAVRGKQSPKRFVKPVREQARERSDRLFTEEHLDAFFKSLDEKLMPSAFADDPDVQRVWHRFWSARCESRAAFFWRYIDEMAKRE